jgi:hypothetical protein
MLEGVKKYGIIIIMAILFATFCFSIADIIYERPDYNKFCPTVEKPVPQFVAKEQTCKTIPEPTEQEINECAAQRGFIDYKYDTNGCPVSYKCNTCSASMEDAMKRYNLNVFIIVSIMGVIAIIAGMYAKAKVEVVEWVYSGILIGGIAAVFIATMMYFGDMSRYAKPFVLLIEMGLIVWVAVRTTKNIVSKKK